jgi:GNAT superfamily N-acetyltransferase
MHKVVQVVEFLQPAAISCYALVLKSGSCMVPNTFGVMVGDHDRVFFQLASLPNNVVMPFGCLRSLAEADLPRPYIRTGIPEYDKWTWSDHWYDLQTNRNRRILVYEAGGRLCAVLSYDLLPADEIFVQLVAVDKATRGQGLGGHLLRWAETHGRATRCARVYLWADDRTVTFYEKMGYDRVSAHPMALDPGKYWKMARALIYSLPSGPNS